MITPEFVEEYYDDFVMETQCEIRCPYGNYKSHEYDMGSIKEYGEHCNLEHSMIGATAIKSKEYSVPICNKYRSRLIAQEPFCKVYDVTFMKEKKNA